jgi:NTE family protein
VKKTIVSLALQGGGSHGAFTWGVLDRLLEDERIEIEAISGASAGAVNAVVLAHGLTSGASRA